MSLSHFGLHLDVSEACEAATWLTLQKGAAQND